jgi:hypothetical protein
MKPKRTFGNNVLIKLDPENEKIKFASGVELFIDPKFEPEKHVTVTGIVYGLPSHLSYTGKPNIGMPWKTEIELRLGDYIVFYYMAVINALSPETKKAFVENSDRFVFIQYQNIYAIIRDGNLIPINGFCLVEPVENPVKKNLRLRHEALNLIYIDPEKNSKISVVYGLVQYVGIPNQAYIENEKSDIGVDISVGDTIFMKRITDIPLEYEYHMNFTKGKQYWRVQRHQIMGKV